MPSPITRITSQYNGDLAALYLHVSNPSFRLPDEIVRLYIDSNIPIRTENSMVTLIFPEDDSRIDDIIATFILLLDQNLINVNYFLSLGTNNRETNPIFQAINRIIAETERISKQSIQEMKNKIRAEKLLSEKGKNEILLSKLVGFDFATIDEQLLCPISGMIMDDPVVFATTVRDGKKENIINTTDRFDHRFALNIVTTTGSCPITRNPIDVSALLRDPIRKKACDDYVALQYKKYRARGAYDDFLNFSMQTLRAIPFEIIIFLDLRPPFTRGFNSVNHARNLFLTFLYLYISVSILFPDMTQNSKKIAAACCAVMLLLFTATSIDFLRKAITETHNFAANFWNNRPQQNNLPARAPGLAM